MNYFPLEGKAKQIYLCRTFQNTKAILKCFTSGHIFSCCHWESYMQMGFSDKANYVNVSVARTGRQLWRLFSMFVP